MEQLGGRATKFGWNSDVLGILNIPEDPLNAAGELNNLLVNYGMISIERVRAFEETYIHLPIRAANNMDMLYKYQMASLSESAGRIICWRSTIRQPAPQGNHTRQLIRQQRKHVDHQDKIEQAGSVHAHVQGKHQDIQ
jgi:hypothetical protein